VLLEQEEEVVVEVVLRRFVASSYSMGMIVPS
jgi:hypothetical protein